MAPNLGRIPLRGISGFQVQIETRNWQALTVVNDMPSRCVSAKWSGIELASSRLLDQYHTVLHHHAHQIIICNQF